MKLLKITENDLEQIDEYFEETETIELDKAAPEVIQQEPDVKVAGKSIEEYDAVYAEIPEKNAVFGRVLLEMIEEKGIPTNYTSTGFFIMAKKNYLYYTLHQKDIQAPKTVVVATEKAARNTEKELKGPLIGRRLENLQETETQKLDEVNQIQSFTEGAEYEEDIILFHEYNKEDKYKCLVAGDTIISAKDDSDGWQFSNESLKYSNISDTQTERVKQTVKRIGTPIAEVLLRGDEVYDVNPNPDLQKYTKVSGKDAFEAVAETIKNR